MHAPSDEPAKRLGNLDLPRLFQADALSLTEAVARGKLLHETKNIRESGGPLEARLRGIFADRMPGDVQVAHGYLYDAESNCTPQIDAMLLSRPDNHSMMTTVDGATYAPFTSALALIEIKSAVGDASKQLEQTKEIVQRIRRMAKELSERRGHVGARLQDPVSILFYATSAGADIRKFKDWSTQNPGSMPTYIVFLDRGCILTATSIASTLLDCGDELSIEFDDHRQPAKLCLCRPMPEDELRCGRLLLWIYYTLLNVANNFEGKRRPARDFVKDAVRRYPISSIAELASVDEWPSSLQP